MIRKIKYLLQSHFLQTIKLSDALYKFWRLLFLDNHSHVSIEYSILWLLLLFDANMAFNQVVALVIMSFKSMSCTRDFTSDIHFSHLSTISTDALRVLFWRLLFWSSES